MTNKKLSFLIASDSFKDCLPSQYIAHFLGKGIREIYPRNQISIFPVADGGDGTASCISFHRKATWIERIVSDPLGRALKAKYLKLEKENTAIIELASASGLELLSSDERNALETSTTGTGELIRDALDKNVRKIILTIGGSATVDGGAGIAEALGFRFLDKNRKIITPVRGKDLKNIHHIETHEVHPLFWKAEVIIACDVQNILNGPDGAARVYGPQKGAGKEAVKVLEQGLKQLSELLFEETGFRADDHPGTGAAGGAALFFLAYGKGILNKGIEIIAAMTGLEEAIKKCDIVITGEGKIDRQTAFGKVVSYVSFMAHKHKKTLIGVTGLIEGDKRNTREAFGMKELYSIRDLAMNDKDSITNAPAYLYRIGKNIAENQ